MFPLVSSALHFNSFSLPVDFWFVLLALHTHTIAPSRLFLSLSNACVHTPPFGCLTLLFASLRTTNYRGPLMCVQHTNFSQIVFILCANTNIYRALHKSAHNIQLTNTVRSTHRTQFAHIVNIKHTQPERESAKHLTDVILGLCMCRLVEAFSHQLILLESN